MLKTILLTTILFLNSILFSQEILVFKKKNNTLKNYWVGNSIAFMQHNKTWQKGEIKKIFGDSFYIVPTIILYTGFSIDTIKQPLTKYSFKDVYAMPNEGIQIDWNGYEFATNMQAGKKSWKWIKYGTVFKTVGLGYAILNVANATKNGSYNFEANKTHLLSGMGLFLFGCVIRWFNKPYLKLNHKYRLVSLKLA